MQEGESCDDGNADNSDAFPQNCLIASCVDGFVQGAPTALRPTRTSRTRPAS
jgi:hypothetical protein